MNHQQDFANLLQQIDFDPKVRELVLDSWEIKTFILNQEDKQVKLEIKPLAILPIQTIDQFLSQLRSRFKIEINWIDQTDWAEALTNVKTYLTKFFVNVLSENDVPSLKFDLKIIDHCQLQLVFCSQYCHNLFSQQNNAQELLLFLRNYGIYVKSINFDVDVTSKANVKKSRQKVFDQPDANQMANYTKQLEEGTLEGKILTVSNRMFSNKQTFEFLLEGKEEAKEFVLSKQATIFDSNRDTDLLKKGKWVRVHFSKLPSDDKGYQKKPKFIPAGPPKPLRLPVIKLEKIAPFFKRHDHAPKKRVELHVHTKMSALDGIGDISDYLAYANHWKHQAIAITDHQNVHIFPDCDQIAQQHPDLKVIFGCEFEFLGQPQSVLTKPLDTLISDAKLLFFDLETTGLSPYFDEIIEFAGVVVQNGITLAKESFLIQSKKQVPDQIYEFTHISPKQHQEEAIPFAQAMQKIKALFANHVLVAHNASFDVNFLNIAFAKLGIAQIDNPVLDTLSLSYHVQPDLSSHRLQRLARKYKIPYSKTESHRAIYDTKVLQKLFENLINSHKLLTFQELFAINQKPTLLNKGFYDHIIVLAKNQQGLRDLYHLVSHTHTQTLYKKPLLLKKDLEKHRQNLLVGSSCYNGEVFKAACYANDQTLIEKMQFYDYLEIQPPTVYQHLVDKQILTVTDIHKAIIRIITFAKKFNKLVVATGDVHYLEPEHRLYRDVFVFNKQLGGEWHDLYDFQKRLKQTPLQHFRTTEEMLKEFAFLNDSQLINEVVITNPNLIANKIERIRCFDDQFVMPQFPDAGKKLQSVVKNKVLSKYGPSPDPSLRQRLDQELKNIIDANYSTIYLISYYLTDYSTKQKYFFGSRGSVGSSFVAHCLDITEVNPLPPHYLCKKCYYFEWSKDSKCLSGFDLKEEKCPGCKTVLNRDGHQISFETFLGLDSENIPDIDLNFSGEFQQRAQQFVVDLFTEQIGENKIFWTGTVSTVAEKSAYGYYKSFLESHGTSVVHNQSKAIAYCSGIKKTTGQHPGGLMIIPKEKDILDFSPYNYPSNNKEGGNFTTHFDYHVLHNRLLKIDILGHDDPTGLKMLYQSTGVNPKDIFLGDPAIIKLFSDCQVLGLPEFGTTFVLRLLKKVKVRTFADLIAISGLSHGKNVWESNAKDLIDEQGHSLSSVISSRDDILFFLIKSKVERRFAYQIMQKVKKGLLLSNSEEKVLQKHQIPQWYIDSCKKIKYLFPKAHAVAYVIMACRFAWFKIKHPHQFYAVYFSIHAVVFDLATIVAGKDAVVAKIKAIESLRHKKNATVSTKEKTLLPLYEVAKEMLTKKISIVNLDLKQSQEREFIVKEINGKKVIIPPFSVIDRLGLEFAKKIVAERNKQMFTSQEDFKTRTGVNKTVFENLITLGLFKDLSRGKQNTFDF